MKKLVPIVVIVTFGLLGVIYLKSKNTRHLIASVEANTVEISAQVASTVSDILVKEGEPVSAQSLLVKLKCEDILVELKQVEKDFQRVSQLFKQGVSSSEAYEKIQTQFNMMKTRLGWCEIKSPLKATVNWILKDVGEFVSPGQKLISLVDLDHLYAWFYVSQGELPLFSLQQKLKLQLPEMGEQSLDGVIEKINSTAEFTPRNVQTVSERDRLVYGIKVGLQTLPNKSFQIKPGMTVEIVSPDIVSPKVVPQ